MARHHLTLPALGIDDQPIRVSLWLAPRGSHVAEGDPILEVLAGPATVDLPAPADGVLIETLVEEDDLIAVGQRLAVIESE